MQEHGLGESKFFCYQLLLRLGECVASNSDDGEAIAFEFLGSKYLHSFRRFPTESVAWLRT
jgi:hypothetical protein